MNTFERDRFIDLVKRNWKRAMLLTNEGHWLQSEVAVLVYSKVGGNKADAFELMDYVGIPANTKKKLHSMGLARGVVPDRDVWTAVGWDGVRRLVVMADKERKQAVAEIRKGIEAGEKPKAVAARVLPKPEPAKAKKKNSVEAHTRGGDLLTKALDALAKLARLNPVNLEVIPGDVRKAVEQRMAVKATA